LIPAVLYSTTESTNAPVPGSTLRFGLYPTAGTAKISSGPTAPYVFDITYQMRVTGLADNGSWIWPPNEPALSSNGSQLSWKDDAGQTATFNGNTVEEPIVQPYLVVAKSCEVATIGPDAVTTSTVTVTNTGDGPAYIVNGRPGLADLMPDHTSIIDLVSVTASPTQSVLASGTDYTWAPSASGFTVDYQQSTSSATVLQPGEALVFVYRWGTDVAVGSGASLVNTASVDWSSMPTTDQAAARTYDATHAAQLPDRVATNTVDVPLASLIKTVAPIDMVAIGQTTTYTVTVSPPLATALYGTVVTDHVPDGLTVVSADSPWGGSVVLGAKLPDGSTPVTWTIGDIANPPHSSLTLDLRVRVDDTFADGTPVNGLPEGVGGRPPDAFVNQATLTWNDAASGRPHVATSEPATVTATEPHLVITKSADATSAAAGGEVTYTLRVNNDGASGAWGVGLQDLIPEPLYAFGSSPQLLSVTRDNVPLTNITDYLYLGTNPFYLLLGDTANGSIPASSTVELTYRCTAQGGLVYGDTLINDAAVTRSYSYSTIQARAYSGPEASVPLETLLPGLVTTKSVQDNVVPRSGVASFTYTVHNVGTAAAHGFTLADAVPPGFTYVAGSTAVSWPSGSSTADPAIIGNAVTGGSLTWSLDATAHAGETLTLTFRAIVGSNAVTGSWTDTCTATALDNAGTPVFPDSQIPADTDLFDRDSATILVTNPHLQVTKARADDPPATVRPGDFVDYVIAVYNDGDTTMTVVPMTDTWDGTKLQYVSAIPPADSTTAGSATWDDITSGILVIEPGAQEEVAVRLLALTGGVDIVDTATVAAAIDVNGDTPPSANDTASVSVTSPGVTVTKTMGDTIVPVGHEVTGTIEVSNSGDTTIAVVPLTDAFNASRLRFDAASPTQSSVVGGLISWADITGGAGLRPGASTSVEITFTAILSGSVPDTATVAGTTDFFGDTVPTSTAEATVTVTNPHVAITKQLAAGQNPFVQLGGRVTYDLVVTNDGDTALITVPMTDTFDALRLLYVGSSRSEDSSSTGVLTWNNLGLLAPGESTTVTVSFDVVAIGSPITDVASLAGVVDVNGDSAPSVTATDTALTGTNPHVAITKTLHPGQSEGVLTGQPVVYDIAITNDGDTILTTVPLVDDFDYYHLEFSSADPVQDDQQDGTIWWNDVTGAGSLAPHETTTVTVSLTAKGAHLSVTDTATVSGATDEHRGVAPTETAANSQVSIVGPGITVVKEIESPGRYVQVGELVVYDIDVFNSGDTTITWAPVTDTFDSEHLEFVSSVPPPDSTTFNTLTWTSIASTQAPITQDREGETYVTFRVIAPSPSIVDTATVAGARDNFGNVIPTQHNDDRQLVGTNPQMSVAKSLAIGQSALIPVGDTVTYSITCTNTGDTDMVSVPLTDVFDSARLAWVSSTPAADSVGTSSASWNDITGGAGLASGEATTVSVTLRATASGVSVTDTATISGAVDEHGGIPPTVSAADSTLSIHKLVPLSIVKTGRDVNGGSLRPGDEILWTITVSNNDVVPSTNTIVYDTIHAPAIYVRGSMTGPGADESGAPNLVWRVGTIPGGAQVVLTVRSKVPVSAGNRTAVSNQAQVISDTSSMMSSSSQSGAVANPTVVFVRTSGNEAPTLALILMLLLGGFGLILPASRRWLPAFVSERVAVARATRMWALAIGTLMLSAALVFGLVLVQPGWADSASGAFARLTAGTSASAPAPTGAGSAVRSRAGARVTIKRIGISTRLVDGTNMGALKRGAWRQPPSARPGEAGNTVIAGHRIKSQFRRLKEARRGDLVTVTYGGYKRRYRVKSIHTVSGRKMSSLLTRGGVETLTLYTCTTMWSGDKRTVVVCTPAR
jgi:LPXTG-site transpeptidase (sortase) family protein